MKTFVGERTPVGTKVYIKHDDGIKTPTLLPLRTEIINHSPTGFEWGYAGSGPAQLALALLAEVCKDLEIVKALYQNFKFSIVSVLDYSHWSMTESFVLRWLHNNRVQYCRDRICSHCEMAGTDINCDYDVDQWKEQISGPGC